MNAGHEKFNSGVDIASLIISNAIEKALYSPASALGLRNFKTSNAKQSRLFSSKRVVRLKAPPVTSDKLIPVKLLTVPVFPPILIPLILVETLSTEADAHLPSSGYFRSQSRVSRLSCTKP